MVKNKKKKVKTMLEMNAAALQRVRERVCLVGQASPKASELVQLVGGKTTRVDTVKGYRSVALL